MPVATINSTAKRYDLKSLPAVGTEEGGFIMARPLPYGMKLERRDKSTIMRLEQRVGKKRSIKQDEETQKIEITSVSEWAAQFDFAYCVTEHNLTDVNGELLDLASPMTLKILDPKIGSELETILAELNGDDVDEEDAEDFIKRHTSDTVENAIPIQDSTT